MRITKARACPCCEVQPSIYESFDSLMIKCPCCGRSTKRHIWDGEESTFRWEDRAIAEWEAICRKAENEGI